MDDLKPQELVTQLESIAVMELRFHPTVASVLRQSARYIKQSLQSQPTVERAELKPLLEQCRDILSNGMVSGGWQSHASSVIEKVESAIIAMSTHRPADALENAAGQVSSYKDTDETGSAANPAPAAPESEALKRLSDHAQAMQPTAINLALAEAAKLGKE